METFVARQPILDTDCCVFGYELLFRSGKENVFSANDGDFATASLISDAIHFHGLNSLVGGRKCFVNLTRQGLLEEVYSMLPPENTVVEVLETVEPDQEVLAACRKVREAGYTLALDDYVIEEKFAPLLPLIDILKVEFPATTEQQQKSLIQLRRQYKFDLLAEKVEQPEEFARARQYGYSLFQGYFFSKPELHRSRRLPASRITYLRFLQAINRPELDVKAIEQLISQEVSLSYKLLRYMNTAAFGMRRGVKSIHHAITLLGQRPLRKWASLVAVNEINDEKPPVLMNTCLIRARFCELLGNGLKDATEASDLFLFGMFSLLDAMLDRPMQEILNELALPENIRAGLTDPSAPLRPVLDLVVAFERGDWSTMTKCIQTLGMDSTIIHDSYRDALLWSSEIMRELAGAESSLPLAKAAS